MSIDYKALCAELFGTTDVDELRVLAKKLEAKNDRGAGRKMKFSKSEILMMEQMRKQGIPFRDIEREFNTLTTDHFENAKTDPVGKEG